MKRRLAAAVAVFLFSCLPPEKSFYPTQTAADRFREINVSTVDYAGGTPVKGVPVTVFNEKGEQVEVYENKDGCFVFRPGKKGVYSLRAGGGNSGRAVSICSGITVPSVFSSVELRLPESDRPAEPPRFSPVKYFSDTNDKGNILTDCVLSGTPEKVSVSITGIHPVDSSTAYTAKPIIAALDDDPYSFFLIESVTYPEIGIPDGSEYRTSAEFDLSLFDWEEGVHYLVFRAFDVYGNNTLHYVPFSLLRKEKDRDESISSYRPEWIMAEARTFGVSRNLFTTESGNSTRYVSLDFRIYKNKAEPAAVRGFLIYRSEDGKNYECIAKMNHGGLYDSLSYNFTDTDARLRFGETYMYKIRAYADRTLSRYSDAVSVVLNEPYFLEMSQPADGAVVETSPVVSFRLTSVGTGNLFFHYREFSFSVNIGQVGVTMYEYPLYSFDAVYDCAADSFSETNGLPYLNLAFSCNRLTGEINVDLSAFSADLLKPGVSYWVYIGNENSAHGPYFRNQSGISSSVVFGSSAEWGGIMTDTLRVFSIQRSGT